MSMSLLLLCLLQRREALSAAEATVHAQMVGVLEASLGVADGTAFMQGIADGRFDVPQLE